MLVNMLRIGSRSGPLPAALIKSAFNFKLSQTSSIVPARKLAPYWGLESHFWRTFKLFGSGDIRALIWAWLINAWSLICSLSIFYVVTEIYRKRYREHRVTIFCQFLTDGFDESPLQRVLSRRCWCSELLPAHVVLTSFWIV